MNLIRKIGRREFDLSLIAMIEDNHDTEGMAALPIDEPDAFTVYLHGGYKFGWSKDEKAIYDNEIRMHKKVMGVVGGITATQTAQRNQVAQ